MATQATSRTIGHTRKRTADPSTTLRSGRDDNSSCAISLSSRPEWCDRMRPTQGMKITVNYGRSVHPVVTAAEVSAALPFVIPSEAEGPAVSFCPSDLTAPNKSHRPTLCHPDRSVPGFPATRHSQAATCAAFSKESRMKFANAANLNRKSGVAEWRDLRFSFGPCW